MEAKVIVAFTDKNDYSRVYNVGDTFKGSDERVAELVASGHVEAISEKKQRKASEG